MARMTVNGACHCGALAFTAVIDPDRVTICHCTDCQTLSGSAFRVNVGAAAADFQLLRGEPRIYEKTAESGAKRLQAFCGECGAQIYAADALRQTYSVRVGVLAQREQLTPSLQIWRGSAQDWVDHIAPIAQIAAKPGNAARRT